MGSNLKDQEAIKEKKRIPLPEFIKVNLIIEIGIKYTNIFTSLTISNVVISLLQSQQNDVNTVHIQNTRTFQAVVHLHFGRFTNYAF